MVIRLRWQSMIKLTALLLFVAAAAAASVAHGGIVPPERPEEQKQEVSATLDEAPTEYRELPTEAAQTVFQPRLSAPDTTDACYYSQDNIFYEAGYGMPNCTCYAWGRAYELTGEKPLLSPSDAGTWYDYNRENGIYDYGDVPRRGAIACWKYADGGPGHVAVVEDIDDDVILCSNSAYSGTEFYLDTLPVDDPSAGRENWIFQGYIYVNGVAKV